MYKKIFGILVISLLVSGCSGANIAAQGIKEIDKTVEEDNMGELIYHKASLIKNQKEDFKNGSRKNVALNESGQIELESGKVEGLYTSPEISTENFNELVASWNTETPENTYIELSVQAKVEGQWTMWYSYGKWSSNKNSGSVRDQSDKLGKLSIDTLEILWGKYANGLRYKVELVRADEGLKSPTLTSIYMTLKTEDKDLVKLSQDINYLVELDIPERSQMIVPEIGNRICSPTSLAMVLEYYGHDIKTEEVAARVIDNEVDIYGNWSYNVSYAGSKGLDAYVQRFNSVDEIKKKIADGIPVIASIKTKSETTLVGAPQTYPSGHLIVIRGFKIKDGEEYIIVNDPASPDLENVRREYELSGFENAWSNMVYVISADK